MTDKQIRPSYEIVLMHDHILRIEEELKRKEQECKELKEDLRKNFEEKDTLHLIIDRLLEASGYDTNTASAEDFEDVYKHMRYEQQQLDQLKAENKELKAAHDTNISLADKLFKLEAALKQIQKQFGIEILYCKVTGESTFRSTEILKLKQTLDEIKEIARVNSINTCWTVLNICDECEEQNKCEDQSPFTKLKQILQKISEVENGNN